MTACHFIDSIYYSMTTDMQSVFGAPIGSVVRQYFIYSTYNLTGNGYALETI